MDELNELEAEVELKKMDINPIPDLPSLVIEEKKEQPVPVPQKPVVADAAEEDELEAMMAI